MMEDMMAMIAGVMKALIGRLGLMPSFALSFPINEEIALMIELMATMQVMIESTIRTIVEKAGRGCPAPLGLLKILSSISKAMIRIAISIKRTIGILNRWLYHFLFLVIPKL